MEQQRQYFDAQLSKLPTSELYGLVADAKAKDDKELLGLIRNEVALRIQELNRISISCSDATIDMSTRTLESNG
ncbi:MAG: hypothetical protein WEC17_00740 [Candidatus Saccharimonadales bacterium]